MPKGTDPSEVDLAMALKLLSLPREVGAHPEDGKMITANFGRFGPYVAHDGKYASLESPDEVFNIGINHAVTLLAEKKAKGRAGAAPQALKELGADADGSADQGAEGPLWSLCQRRRRPTPPFPKASTRERDAGTGAGADRRTRGQGRRQEEEEEAGAKAESRSQSRKRRERKPRRQPRKKPRAKKKAAKAKKKPEPVAGE